MIFAKMLWTMSWICLDPSEGGSALFASYDFLISLNHILGTAMFTILGSVMGARLIVETYGDKKAVLLFSYPVFP